jgi:hypothetical protein
VTKHELEILIGRCKSTEKNERSKFASILLSCEKEIRALHKEKHVAASSKAAAMSNSMLVWVDRPWRKFFDRSDFEDLNELIGSRHNELTGEIEYCSFLTYVADPGKHMCHAALVFGGDATSGFGKTSVCDRACFYWAKSYAPTFNINSAYYIYTRTIEGLKRVKTEMQAGVPILCDEINLSDDTQIQYLSEDGLKQLLDITSMADLRARNENVTIYPNQPLLMTANADSIQAWLGGRATECLPIMRRFWCCQLTTRILKATAAKREQLATSAKFDGVAVSLASDF